jgi:hypothetical protein
MWNEFPNRAFNLITLHDEVAALALPAFAGVGRRSRRQITEGEDRGKWAVSQPSYIIVKSDALTSSQMAQVQVVLDAHTGVEI